MEENLIMKCLPNIGQIPDQEQRIWEMLLYQSSVIAALQHKSVSNEKFGIWDTGPQIKEIISGSPNICIFPYIEKSYMP